jgi:uncharacterized protein YbaP (TraB family)
MNKSSSPEMRRSVFSLPHRFHDCALAGIAFYLFLCLTVLANSAFAETRFACPPVVEQPAPEAVQAAMRKARDHGFLWRISKNGRTSYLFGTIHVAKFDWMFPGPSVMQAIQAADTVALELDGLDADMQNRLVAGMASMPSAALPASLVKRIQQLAGAECIPYEALAKLSPELQVTTLTMMVGRRDGLEASYAIDTVLAGIGHGAKKNMVSLETPEMQLQLLQMQSPQETISFVQEGLDEMESGRSRSLLNRMSRDWANADYAEMSHFDEWCECLDSEIERVVMKRLLDGRNPDLAAHIDALHSNGKQVFAAVGSLHMFGPVGLPALMAKRGYRVERVDFKPQ